MSQHDYTIADGSGAAVLADMEDAFQSLASGNLKTTAPSTTYQGMIWWDSSGSPLLLRKWFDGTDWIIDGVLDLTNNLFTPVCKSVLPSPPD
jgi:hypothetical protein